MPVLLALAPLTGFDEAEFLAHEVPGVTIPEATLRALERAGRGAADVGLDLAAGLAAQASPWLTAWCCGSTATWPPWSGCARHCDQLCGRTQNGAAKIVPVLGAPQEYRVAHSEK